MVQVITSTSTPPNDYDVIQELSRNGEAITVSLTREIDGTVTVNSDGLVNKFRYSLDNGTSWIIVIDTLPYNIPASPYQDVMVEPIGSAITDLSLEEVAPVLRQVATRSLVPNSCTIAKRLQSRTGHIAREALTTIKLGFTNWIVNDPQSVNGNYWKEVAVTGYGDISITASVEYPAGVFTQVLFGGVATQVMTGSGVYNTYLSDDIAVNIPDGATFWVRTFLSGNNVLHYGNGINAETPIVDNVNFGDVCAIVNDTSLTDNTMGGAYGTASPYKKFAPALILQLTTAKAVFLLGDSRTIGSVDTADSTGDIGNLARGVGQNYGYSMLAIGGMAAVDRATGGYLGNLTLLPYFTHFINELGFNDIAGLGRTAAQVEEAQATIWGYLSSNGGIVGQLSVERGGTVGDVVNAANSALPAGLGFYCDTNSIVMPGGVPLPGGWNADNVHESQLGFIAIRDSGVITLP